MGELMNPSTKIKKSKGRPVVTGKLPGRSVRLTPQMWEAIEDWRRAQPTIPTVAEALRMLLARGLAR
jgi:hypothetical protein